MGQYKDIKDRLLEEAYKNEVPIVGEFELTSFCNFCCEMCYAKSSDSDLTKAQWINIFEQAHSQGMLFALLTGGEIFSRPDFIVLYEYLFDLGIKITLYTNASLLPEEVLIALVKRPPESIVITLYGYDRQSYLEFTKNNAFLDISRNIDLLIEKGFNLSLRTIPLPSIYKNLDNIIDFAKEKELHLGYFLYVSKKNKQMKRLNALELIDFERRIRTAFPLVKTNQKTNPICGAFRYGFFVNHQGIMQGCPMMPLPSEKVSDNLIKVYKRLKYKWFRLLEDSPCKDCELKNNCFTCLANRYLEGNMFACSSYLKDFAEESSK